MEYEISNRMAGLKPSIIRELLKQMSDPTLISFAGGNPAQDSFPVEEIAGFSDALLRGQPTAVLQYSVSEGVPAVRGAMQTFLNRRWRLVGEEDELIVTSGSQQVLDIAAKVLCNEGDTVAVEDPAFLSAYLSFRSYGAKLAGVPMQADGVDLDALEAVFAAKPRPRFFYCIPNFQNPTGRTMSLEKRKAVYALAVKYGVPVLEDDPYGELRFSGEDLPPIKAFDTEGAVLYAASFSKILCPGMRLAACVAPQGLARHLVVAKQSADVHTTVWSQRICGEMLEKVDMDAHIQNLRRLYRDKAQCMMDALDELCPALSYEKPQGGMFLWPTLPAGVPMQDYVRACLEQGVALVPGNAFQVNEDAPCQSFRMNFSSPSKENIRRGVERMARVLARFL